MLQEKLQRIPKSELDTIIELTQTYKNAGYECYLVGGSFRDLMMDEVPHDFDFATNCPLEETQKLFRRVYLSGADHGTVTVILHNIHFEVTRYRKDVETDGRRAVVSFAETAEEDQERRDLRINAMAYDVVDHRVVDSQGGLKDFEEKIIRFVGDAETRIREDHLRAIRYLRMVSRFRPLGFDFDPNEMKAVLDTFDATVLSIERVYEEFSKIFKMKAPDWSFLWEYLPQLRVFRAFFNNPDQELLLVQESLKRKNLFPLYYEYQKEHPVKETAIDLKMSRKDRWFLNTVCEFEHENFEDVSVLKRMLSIVNDRDDIPQLLELCEQQLEISLHDRVQTILDKEEPLTLQDLMLNGEDLKALDIRGKKIGKVFRSLLEAVWLAPEKNTRKELTRMAILKRDQF